MRARLLLIAIACLAAPVAAAPMLGPWQPQTAMPGGKLIHQSVVVDGWLYVIAGSNSAVYYTRINPDGSLAAWKQGPPLAVNYHSAVAAGRRIYVLSGGPKDSTVVHYGDVQADGAVAEWTPGRALPAYAKHSGRAVICGGSLYYLGGWHVRDVYRASIQGNGDLGEWQRMTPLPTTLQAMGVAAAPQALTVFGGARIYQVLADGAWRAPVLADGTLGRWSHTVPLLEPRQGFGFCQTVDRVFVLGGGGEEQGFTDESYTARLLPDGSLADWQPGPSLPRRFAHTSAVAWGGRVYLIGGWFEEADGKRGVSNEVWSAAITGPETPVVYNEAQAEHYPVRFPPGGEITSSAGWLQLRRRYVQRGKEPLVIEAENSTRITFAASTMTAKADPTASGGAYLDYLRELENEVVLATPGTYQAWYRAYFPVAGSWNHNERMDDGEVLNVTDSYFGPAREWVWVKGPQYSLSKGEHQYVWPSPTAWCGGARLDKLVLAPMEAPPPTGFGPPATPPIESATGTIVSQTYRLDDFAAWSVVYEAQGRAMVEYSLDRGKTWRPAASGALVAVNPAAVRVQFRVTLQQSPTGEGGRLSKLALVGYGG